MVRAGTTAPTRYAPELSQPRHYRPLTRQPRSRRSSPARVRLLVSVRGEDTQPPVPEGGTRCPTRHTPPPSRSPSMRRRAWSTSRGAPSARVRPPSRATPTTPSMCATSGIPFASVIAGRCCGRRPRTSTACRTPGRARRLYPWSSPDMPPPHLGHFRCQISDPFAPYRCPHAPHSSS